MNQLRIVVMDNGPLLVDDHDTTLRQLGMIDAHTGLPHRDLLLDRLNQATAGVARGGSAFALMYVGLQPSLRWKSEESLESVLQQFACQLPQLGRRTDSFARMNATEFVALLPGNPSVAGLMSMGQKVALAFADRLQVHIGVALCPRHASDAETLLTQAHQAMEQARLTQALTLLYEPRTSAPPAPSTAAAHPFSSQRPGHAGHHSGLSQPNVPLFQPVIDLRTGALARLQISSDELQQLHDPITRAHDDFSASEYSTLTATGQLSRQALRHHVLDVLEAALRCAQAWRQQGLVKRLSLALPNRLLHDDTLVPAMVVRLDRYRWPAHHLLVEVQSAAVAQRNGEAVRALQAAGMPLIIDDSQSGLSLHLALSGALSAAEIKFHAPMLRHLPRPEQRSAVLQALGTLAQGWGAQIVAEGVADVALLSWLAEQGCPLAQGPVCGRVMPEEQVLAWYAGAIQGRPSTLNTPSPQ